MSRREYNRLKASFVRTVAAPGQYWDGHGLILRVTAAGTKQWVQRLRIRGKRRELGLGGFPLVTLAQARETALTNRREARAGGDPLGEKRREQAAAVTFEALSREVFDLKRSEWTNAKHAAQWIGTLEEYAFPRLARRAVADVDANDVLEVLKPLLAKAPTTAKRLRQRISVVIAHAVSRGLRLDNPAEAVAATLRSKSRGDRPHHRALPYGEVAEAIAAVRESTARPATRLALEFLTLTAARSGEVREATWDEIDLEARLWTVPAVRMKAGREHRIPLSNRAIEILDEAWKLGNGRGLVFPARPASDKGIHESAFVQLLKRLRIDGTAHGFRSSFRDWAAERTNTSREVCEAALAHTIANQAEAAYARSDLFEKRRELMERWARYLNPEPAAVVSLDAHREAAR